MHTGSSSPQLPNDLVVSFFNVNSEAIYQLIDFGEGKKLEKIGGLVVERPSPGATDPLGGSPLWEKVDLAYRDQGWHYLSSCSRRMDWENWKGTVDSVTLRFKPTAAGQVGIFPEHWTHWPWFQEQYVRLSEPHLPQPRVLHLFAYTGATTLALAARGFHVTHVDASRPTVAWARENGELSGLKDRPVRWIVDDAVKFVDREVRRGNRYCGLILDPPSFGHGTQAERWQIHRDLLPLLHQCWKLLDEERGFALLCGHSPDIRLRELARSLGAAHGMRRVEKNRIQQAGLEDSEGRTLDCGYASLFEW
ncbi:Ribosomal RNA large subunit methyltransferase K [Pirellula sp. SH-Sr6A]|nr:Ribosomal RNA large subunit methyltransferase K [Pirellula sp. SH-Sr6A]